MKEFTWNPALSIEGYAYLFTLKEFRREEPQIAEAYARWIRATGCMDMLAHDSLSSAWIRREKYSEELRIHLSKLDTLLRGIHVESAFVERLRRSFERLRQRISRD